MDGCDVGKVRGGGDPKGVLSMVDSSIPSVRLGIPCAQFLAEELQTLALMVLMLETQLEKIKKTYHRT